MYDSFLDLEEEGGRTIHVWPVPYEGTASFARGTRLGPEAILKASYQIETYDHELGQDLSGRVRFETLPFLRPSAQGPDTVMDEMREVLSGFDPVKDFFLTLGGEHSIALPLVEFYHRAHSDLVVIQIDAHADLRAKYEGSPSSHACVMARVRDLGVPLVQIGIRSLCREEAETMARTPAEDLLCLFGWDLPSPDHAARRVGDFVGQRPVYISFDADGLDPSIMPGTGTPEPGGIGFSWMQAFWTRFLPERTLVGLDFCELAPELGPGVISESVAVKCILRILMTSLAGPIEPGRSESGL
ncbi:MAG: agmatinase [Deltaproteobacteria bacterium]|nr:agmatinase [Deltaproteobacteria bacterium]